MSKIQCTIFDFAGTICSEGYFHTLSPQYYDAVSNLIFGESSLQWADPWMEGKLTSQDISEYLSTLWPYTRDQILTELHRGCSNLQFNPAVLSFAQQLCDAGIKLALVTINADVFTQVVVPSHGLDQVFDVIVNSADYGTICKEVLFQKAFDTLGVDQYGFENCLLIDDSPRCIDTFRKRGGLAYQYSSDALLLHWLNASNSSGTISHP